MIKLLTLTSLYPSQVMPHHGVFVENRLHHLINSGEVESRVVAPVPWFPFTASMFGDYAKFAKTPYEETRKGIFIRHPKYLVVPKVGMNITPVTMANTALKEIRSIMERGYDFDIIDAHYFYPDGVAAVKVAQALKKPIVITARGTDINLIPQYKKPRDMIQWAAHNANAMITVCQALKDALIELGAQEDKITSLRNGVDLEVFQPPSDREQLRKDLNIHGKTILSVGHLIERKGHALIIEALSTLPDVKLLIAGHGPDLTMLQTLAQQNQVSDRVSFLGLVPHSKLKDYYGAVDILVLASSREGWANVLLEAMACGTPVVATSIWGTPEVVSTPEAGLLVEQRTPEALSAGIQTLYDKYPDRNNTRKYAEKFSWNDTTQGQIRIFKKILASAG